MAAHTFYDVLAIERYGVSRILNELPIDDLFTCACTSRVLRHLAFGICYRDLTFRLYPPLESPETEEGRVEVVFPKRDRFNGGGKYSVVADEDLDDQDTDSEEEEAFGFKVDPATGIIKPKNVKRNDGDDAPMIDDEESGDTDGMDIDEEVDDASAAAEDSLNDTQATKALTGVLRWFSSRMYITHYVRSLELDLHHPADADASHQPVLLCDQQSFLTLLHSLPRLDNLWLKNILLAGDGDDTAALMAEAHLAPLALRHLCLDVTYRWHPRAAAPAQLLRELLMPFGTIDELRVRRWPDLAPTLAPLPAHLVVHGVVLDERVEMRPLLVALARHPQAHLLRALVSAEERGDVHESTDRAVLLAQFGVVEAVGARLEVFGCGPMNMERAAQDGGLEGDVDDALSEHVFRHLRADMLRTLVVPVTLWKTGAADIDNLRTIWSECAFVLWTLRERAH
ncbi:hypothetical protein PsYK624_151240 [Phanerochaete sordida]|uniref:F-box domain-containing protein n=1 Tax=Phanerochaete sordida TaxID=48140 RepID=A0A9P3GNY3_9APHY|nr:hypothetical protein PsYK624_151240 [Phanerochaete sordida]